MPERPDDGPRSDTLERGLAVAFGPGPASRGALATLGETIGPVPRVLLRDTDFGFDAPPVKPASPELPDGPGRYQLVGEIARGGMGAVLKGRDIDLGRDLAVKVLLEQHRNRPELVRRFVEEAQIGGQLQHPGIVPVYELGTFPDCRPYFAMKLVKGRTLAALLDARSKPTDDHARFLGIFEQIAQTVAYAHARGVIHRDLKPSNVMVGAFGEVQVMDWGLAKVLKEGGIADDERSRTPRDEVSLVRTVRSGSAVDASQAGSVLGTPAYMAPEQAAGDLDAVDERADVFGLGSILCELLTGRPAYTGRTGHEVLRKAARGDTADALARLASSEADPDLRALATDCLAVEPPDRPRDAGRVAEAVATYQNSVIERLRRAEVERAAEQVRAVEERRRRRVTLALAASVLATVLLGGGGASWILQDRRERQGRLDLALQEAKLLRDQAAADPEGGAGKWQVARLALEKAGGVLGATSSAEAKARLADLRESVETGMAAAKVDDELVERLDKIRAGMEGKEADAAYAEAFRAAGLDLSAPEAMSERLKARPAAVREAVVTALDAWSVVSGEETGEAGLRRLLKVARVVDPADAFHNQLRDALERKDLEGFRRLAGQREVLAAQGPVSLWLLGYSLETLGDYPLAVAVLRQGQRRFPGDYWLNLELGLALLEGKRNGVGTEVAFLPYWRPEEKYQVAEPYLTAAVALRPRFAAAHRTLGVAFDKQGKWEEAVAAYRQAITIDPNYSVAHARLGTALARQRSWEESLAVCRQAVALDPKNPWVHWALGDALSSHGDWDEATVEARQTVALDPNSAPAYIRLSFILREQGLLEDSIAAVRQAITLNPKSGVAHENLGVIYFYQGKWEESIAAFQQAIRLDPKNEWTWTALGLPLRGSEKWEEAIAAHRQAIALNPKFAKAYSELGNTLTRQGNHDEAIAAHRRAIALDPNSNESHIGLGVALKAKGKLDEAIAEIRRAIALLPRSQAAYIQLGFTLRAQGKYDEAVAAYREAERVVPKSTGPLHLQREVLRAQGKLDEVVAVCRRLIAHHPEEIWGHFFLGDSLRRQGKLEEAIAESRQMIALEPKSPWGHWGLGLALLDQEKVDEAATELRQADALQPNHEQIHADLERTERMVSAQGRLPAFLKGEFKPQTGDERLGLAGLCKIKRRYSIAAGLYADAFAAEPKLAEDWTAGHLSEAADCAALAGTGPVDEATKPAENERPSWRKQALDWMRADLALRVRQLETGKPDDRIQVRKWLEDWRVNPDLAGVRDLAAVAALPERERDAWRALWADVDRLLGGAGKAPERRRSHVRRRPQGGRSHRRASSRPEGPRSRKSPLAGRETADYADRDVQSTQGDTYIREKEELERRQGEFDFD